MTKWDTRLADQPEPGDDGSSTEATSPSQNEEGDEDCSALSAKKRLRLFNLNMESRAAAAANASTRPLDSVGNELLKYITNIGNTTKLVDAGGLEFWNKNRDSYPLLYQFAQDLLSAPASEAYDERVFSLCDELCAGKRNRTSNNLEMRVFLKMNKLYWI